MNTFEIRKQSDDPMGTIRISCGYQQDIDLGYIIYRGNLAKVKDAMRLLLAELEKQDKEAPEDPRGDTITNTRQVIRYQGTWREVGSEQIHQMEIFSDKPTITEVKEVFILNLAKIMPGKEIEILDIEAKK